MTSPTEPPADTAAPRRFVMLGASNLTKGIATVIGTAQRQWPGPLEVVTALGHGRSYGRTTRILGRELPGILQCDLWPALNQAPRVPTTALVTDIGNDLLYEESVEDISAWLADCFDRLLAADAQVAVTFLPVDNLKTLSRARFLLMRSVFVPHSRITLAAVTERAWALNEEIARLARERGITTIAQRADWYGFDPIHIKFSQRAGAWREIFSFWPTGSQQPPAARGSWSHTLYLRTRVPHARRVLGIAQRRAQPAARLRNGTTIALY